MMDFTKHCENMLQDRLIIVGILAAAGAGATSVAASILLEFILRGYFPWTSGGGVHPGTTGSYGTRCPITQNHG